MKLTAFLAALALSAAPAFAAFVTPSFAGGRQGGPMVMPNVAFDGSGLVVGGVVDMMGMPIGDVPVLRPLPAGDAFDPAKPHAVLGGKAYNFQYGWNYDATGDFDLPQGSSIWIEQTSATPGLMAYEATSYAPIFGTSGTGDAWRWDTRMAHNAYAVAPGVADYSADYRLYLGDAGGVALPGFGEATITLAWTSVPEPASLATLGLGGLALLRRRR